MHLPERTGFVNITPDVEEALMDSGIQEGLCLVNAMHITASVFINDDEPGLHRTTSGGWSGSPLSTRADPPRRLPAQPDRRGQRRRPPQAPGHGPRGDGGITGGHWISAPGADLLREFDGRRDKRVLIKIIGE